MSSFLGARDFGFLPSGTGGGGGGIASVTTNNTPTFCFYGDGTLIHPLCGCPQISLCAGNNLTVCPDGLFSSGGLSAGIIVLDSGLCSSVRCAVNSCASGDYSAALSGSCNTSSCYFSTIVGGFCNIACCNYTFIGGGSCNTNSGYFGFQGGGFENVVSNIAAVSIGGFGNTASGLSSFVGGGCLNVSSDFNSTIVSGVCNTNAGQYAFIGGGRSNLICDISTASFIGGGSGNCITDTSSNSAIVAGTQNFATRGDGGIFIGAGRCNFVGTGVSTIVSGSMNTICLNDTGDNAIVAGSCNTIHLYSNEGSSKQFIGSGLLNTTCGSVSSIVSGSGNIVNHRTGSITNGVLNYLGTSDFDSSLFCTRCNNIGCIFIFGNKISSFNVGDNLYYHNRCDKTVYKSCVSGVSFDGTNTIIIANGSIGQVTTLSGQLRNITTSSCSGCYSSILGGTYNTARGIHSSIVGGSLNLVSSDISSIVTGCCNSITSSASYSVNGSNLIGGGFFNTICGCYTANNIIGGGGSNTISCNTNCSFIGAGQINTICGNLNAPAPFVPITRKYNADNSAIIAGCYNCIFCNAHSLIGTGCCNSITTSSADYGFKRDNVTLSGYCNQIIDAVLGFIGNGRRNCVVDSSWGTITNGANNCIINGSLSFIANGNFNTITDGENNIINGDNNLISGSVSTILNGYSNIVSCDYSIVINGGCNTVSGCYSLTGSGYYNFNQSSYNFIGSGIWNNLCSSISNNCAFYSVIVGGVGNNTSGGTFSATYATSNPTRTNTGRFSFIGNGFQNRTSCCFASVLNGGCNTASARYSFIGNGLCNTSASDYGVIVGGSFNQANGFGSFVGSGNCNISCGCTSFIGGGAFNTINNNFSTNVAGCRNTVSNQYGFNGGGRCNTASGCLSSNVGGERNTVSGLLAFNGGGLLNNVSGETAFSGAGFCNCVTNCQGFSGTGSCNCNFGYVGVIISGLYNQITCGFASGYTSIINGVAHNTLGGTFDPLLCCFTVLPPTICTAGTYSFIGNGFQNIATGFQSFVGGGQFNQANGNKSFVGNGECNLANCCFNTILGGCCNIADGLRSSILGGQSNNTCGFNDAFIIGSSLCASQVCTTFVNCLSAANLSCGNLVCVGANSVIVNTNFGFGAFSDTTVQTMANTACEQVVTFNTCEITNGVTLVNTQCMQVSETGTYGIDFSLQLLHSSGGDAKASVWVKCNCADIPRSASYITVNGNNSEQLATARILVNMNSSDYLQLYWNATDTDVSLSCVSAGASPTRPVSPSIIANIQRIR